MPPSGPPGTVAKGAFAGTPLEEVTTDRLSGPTSAGLAKPDTVTMTSSPAPMATGTARPNKPFFVLALPKQEAAAADAWS